MAPISTRAVRVRAGSTVLDGDLTVPGDARGLVIFAHGSGSSRHSPRNREVASVLQDAGFATLLFDLLTTGEEEADARTGHLRFDIDLLAERLASVVDWSRGEYEVARGPVGLFGASTGAAAALRAAAERPGDVAAVVSRGGRPDLAEPLLAGVRAPTLLLIGERDVEVLPLNEDAAAKMTCVKEVAVIPGASHLFPEAGALESVARHAAEWFRRYLG
ncbi:MAG: hypothetical protein GEV03_19575 [Streptosporangiales bacterium]|nr:hypothetical protein [Streptosporangiales bacterium]